MEDGLSHPCILRPSETPSTDVDQCCGPVPPAGTVSDETLTSLGGWVLRFCAFVSCDAEKEAYGLPLRECTMDFHHAALAQRGHGHPGTAGAQLFISAESEACFPSSRSCNHRLL